MDELCKIFKGKRLNLTVLYGPRYFSPIRYLYIFFLTIIKLSVENPEYVYAQSPPIFCPIACYFYCFITKKELYVDHHSLWSVKTFTGVFGSFLKFFEKFVAISSSLNSTPHELWADYLKRMKARKIIVVHDFVELNPFERDESLRKSITSCKYLAISSHGGHPLERIEYEIKAVSLLQDVFLVITGPEEKLRKRIEKIGLPKNVKYLGFMDMKDYLKLKASCDFAINITDEPYTLSHVILEYLASSLPVISSKQEIVYSFFGDTLIYANSINELVGKIDFLTSDENISKYREKSRKKWLEIKEKVEKERDLLIKSVKA